MKKHLLAIALLSSIASTSFAADNGFIIGADVGSIKNKDSGMVQKSTGVGISGGYRHYIDDIAVDFILSASRYSTDIGSETVLTPQIAMAYDVPLNDTYTLRPKVRLGKSFTKVSIDGVDSPESGRAFMTGLGVELAHKNNYSVEYTIKFSHGDGYKATAHQLGVNYKF